MCFDRVEKFKVHRYYGWKVFVYAYGNLVNPSFKFGLFIMSILFTIG